MSLTNLHAFTTSGAVMTGLMRKAMWTGMVLGGVVTAGALLATWISAQDAHLPGHLVKVDLPAQLPPAQPPAGLRFSVLKTGASLGAFEALIVGGGSWFKYRQPSQMAVLVQHPQATFLFDTGLGRLVDQQFEANGWFHRQVFAYRQVDPAADQLLRAGWKLEQVRWVVPSHMHWDHISGLPDFPHAEVWAQTAEREQASHGAPPAFIASQFASVQRWRELAFEPKPHVGFERSLDLFGDGSVVLVPLGGHTAGQVGMFLSLPSGQRYFFTGDVTWTKEGVDWPADRSWALRQIVHLDHDESANQAAIVRLHHIQKRYPSLNVVPAHDENVLQHLPIFPQFQN